MSFIKTTNKLKNFYFFVFDDLGDVRTKDWFLISSPIPGLLVLFVYLYFVLNFGPKYMRNRKPYNLKLIIQVYNFFQMLYSSYIFYIGFNIYFIKRLMNLTCTPVDQSNSSDAMYVANYCFIYFMAKLTELLDTVFFVLRKKDRQISFLHVYHHTCMCMVSWGATKYFPGGHACFIGMLNGFVHIIMYTYYFLSTFGKRFEKYLWWKKHITIIQMIQFGLFILHYSLPLYFDCGYPKWIGAMLLVPNCAFFMFLFHDFYANAYKNLKVSNINTLINNNELKNGNDKKMD